MLLSQQRIKFFVIYFSKYHFHIRIINLITVLKDKILLIMDKSKTKKTKSIILLYITCSNSYEAQKIGEHLVNKKIVACANIVEHITSVFRWQGKLEKCSESILIAKTKKKLLKKAIKEVKSIHSYECPCILALPVYDGYENFIKWIYNETI